MDDIISHGGPPRGGWRRRAALAGVLIAVAALVVAGHVGHGGAVRPHGRAAGQLRNGHRPEPAGPPVVWSPARPQTVAARMPRAGIAPAWFSPANGAVQPIGGLPRYGFGYAFTRIEGGWVLQPGQARPASCGDCSAVASSTQAGCDSCPGPPVVAYFLGDRARAVTTIGTATMVAPAATADAAWLTTFPAGSGLGTAPGSAREYDSTGKPAGPPVTLPARYKIARATRAGLLLTPLTGQQRPGIDQLWDPASHRVIRTFRGVIAASATRLAYSAPCTAKCPLHLVNLITGRQLTLRLTHGHPVTGQFSPDGRYLALEIRSGPGLPPVTQVSVASLTTRQVTGMPRATMAGSAIGSFGWAANNDHLTVKLIFPAGVRIAYWNPANSEAAVAVIAADLDPGQLVTG